MLTAIIPDPYGIGPEGSPSSEVCGVTPEDLASYLREHLASTGYGASDVGSKFNVYRDGNIVGTLMYNGKFEWRDSAYAE